MLRPYWLDGLDGPLNPPNGLKRKQFHGFGWFWGPTVGREETALWTRKFWCSVTVNIYLKPCIHLKSENSPSIWKCKYWKWERQRQKYLNFWNLPFQNGKTDREWTDLPLGNITPPHRTTPLRLKTFWPPLKTQNSNSPLTLGEGAGGGAHCLWTKKYILFCPLVFQQRDVLNAIRDLVLQLFKEGTNMSFLTLYLKLEKKNYIALQKIYSVIYTN